MLLYINFLPAAQSIEVVTHPGVTEHVLSKNSLRTIFSMRVRVWPDGTPITVFVLSDDAPLHIFFTKNKLNVFSYQLRSTWDRLIFSGTGQAPVRVDSVQEMLARIAVTPGAIGYTHQNQVNDSVLIIHVE